MHAQTHTGTRKDLQGCWTKDLVSEAPSGAGGGIDCCRDVGGVRWSLRVCRESTRLENSTYHSHLGPVVLVLVFKDLLNYILINLASYLKLSGYKKKYTHLSCKTSKMGLCPTEGECCSEV